MRWTKQWAPMRALHVADIGDRRAAKLRRARQAPTHLGPFKLALVVALEDRAKALGKDLQNGVAKNGIDAGVAPFVEAVIVLFLVRLFGCQRR